MTKQDEIREWIAKQLLQWSVDNFYGCPQKDTEGNPSVLKDWLSEPQHVKDSYLNKADQILSYLHSQGVVMKVDRELPGFIQEARDWDSVERIENKLTGYEAVEPLIKEEANGLVA